MAARTIPTHNSFHSCRGRVQNLFWGCLLACSLPSFRFTRAVLQTELGLLSTKMVQSRLMVGVPQC